MTHQPDYNQPNPAVEALIQQGFDGMANALQILFNEAMLIERAMALNAQPYERTDQRKDYANGFKSKSVVTRVGEVELKVPQTRNSDFYPSCIEKGSRSEKSLNTAMAEMYIQGVSTRKVSAIVEQMCGTEVSREKVSQVTKKLDFELEKWRTRELSRIVYLILDARYENVRVDGAVRSCAVFTAFGVNETGIRLCLGTNVSLSEAEIHWRTFFRSLKDRGLRGLECIVSDDHSGLKAALKTEFNGVKWQRCQFHLQRNAQAYVPKQEMKEEVAADIRSIFNATDSEDATTRLNKAIEKYKNKASELAEWMEGNIPEGCTVFNLPKSHRKRLRTTNWAERVNEELKRRTRVINIFPNTEAVLRIVTALLVEMSEGWEVGKKYLNME